VKHYFKQNWTITVVSIILVALVISATFLVFYSLNEQSNLNLNWNYVETSPKNVPLVPVSNAFLIPITTSAN
jgi:hypothetical protein